jgi:hypothetical protein
MPWASYPPAPAAAPLPAKKNRTAQIVVGVLIVLVLVAAGFVVKSISSSSSSSGLNDPNTLSQAIMRDANARYAKAGSSLTATSVTCIAAGIPHEFTCNGTMSNGMTQTVTATVSDDGQTYITSS